MGNSKWRRRKMADRKALKRAHKYRGTIAPPSKLNVLGAWCEQSCRRIHVNTATAEARRAGPLHLYLDTNWLSAPFPHWHTQKWARAVYRFPVASNKRWNSVPNTRRNRAFLRALRIVR